MDSSFFTSYNSLLLWIPALLCGFLSGTTCGTLGAFVVGMRIPFIGICVAHAALAGAVFAALFGLEGQWLMLPALFTSGLTSLLLGVTNPRWIKMDDNVMMSVLFSATMGLAFLGLGLFSVMGRTDGDGGIHYALDQRVELGFCREAGSNIEKTRQGVLHAAH